MPPEVLAGAAARSAPRSNQSEDAPLMQASELSRMFVAGGRPVTAVRSATCVIRAADRIALVGRSGSGKSTLLHLLGGLDDPTSGALSWPALGSAATLRPSKVAFVFQMPSLLAPLSVVENVELPLLLDRRPPSSARTAALAALASMDLTELADKLPEEVSGGQAQRVAMARAIAYQPRLILADEPTGQLDHVTAAHVLDVLFAALAGSPTALVVATHDPAVASRLSATWRMDNGVLEVPA